MNCNSSTERNDAGFALVELIIVVAIIAVMTALLIPSYIRYVADSRKSVCEVNRDEIERLFASRLLSDSSQHPEELRDKLVLEFTDDVCPDGGVDAGCFTLEDNRLFIACRVHDTDISAEEPTSEIVWSELAPSIDDIREIIADSPYKKNYNYVTGQVYFANGSYFVFTGSFCSAELPKDGSDMAIEQALYDDMAYWADIDLGRKMTRLNPSALPLVYEGTEAQHVNNGDLTQGKDGKLYIWIGKSTTAKSPDEVKGSWAEVLVN